MTDPALFERFNGWPVKRLLLPSGDRIIVTFSWDGTEPKRSLDDANYNVYRLNPEGEVVWQVRRDDSVLPPDIWETRHRIARSHGLDGYRVPFLGFVLEYPDGSRKRSDPYGDGKDILVWEPGCIIWLLGYGNEYILDPETGIAKNTPISGREW